MDSKDFLLRLFRVGKKSGKSGDVRRGGPEEPGGGGCEKGQRDGSLIVFLIQFCSFVSPTRSLKWIVTESYARWIIWWANVKSYLMFFKILVIFFAMAPRRTNTGSYLSMSLVVSWTIFQIATKERWAFKNWVDATIGLSGNIVKKSLFENQVASYRCILRVTIRISL